MPVTEKDIEVILQESAPMIDSEIEKVFPKQFTEESAKQLLGPPRYQYDLTSINKAISEPAWDLLSRGGKRWRPALMMLAYEAVSGRPGTEVKEYTPAVEIIHNGTLIADDTEDDSDLRRGKPTTHRVYGVDIAINLSSAMYLIPLAGLFKDTKLKPETKLAIYEAIIKDLLICHIGQATDIYWHKGLCEVENDDLYLQMCAAKTGSLARIAMKLGALLAKGTKEQIEALGAFGEAIGIAFQIQDDILNITESELSKGKGLGEDIHEGKRTLMVIHTLSQANAEDKEKLLQILNSHTNKPNEIANAIQILQKYHSIEFAKEKARAIIQDSTINLRGVLPESEARRKLILFAQYLIEREI